MNRFTPDLIYSIGLTQLRGIGPRIAKKLIAHCGSAADVFREKPAHLAKIEGLGSTVSRAFDDSKKALQRAEQELSYAEKHRLYIHDFQSNSYPRRLRHCEDGPLVLFQKGHTKLNASRTLAIVGTRSATGQGKDFCEHFLRDTKMLNPLVVSGLAYGIDAAAHKQALQNQLPTVAVLAHGLDTVYPYLNRPLAEEMLAAGGSLLSEFITGTKPDRENFPKRNRIIAGMSDAVVVVEAARKGGALITAQLANSYNRDVFAVPGRYNDKFSEGCNLLIKSNQAALLTSRKDLEYIMGWSAQTASVQQELFTSLNADEQRLYNLLEKENKALTLELICHHLQLSTHKALSQLMGLELKGMVKALPGKLYQRC